MWQHMETARLHVSPYEHKGEVFLHQMLIVDETWKHSYKPEIVRLSSEWHHQGSPHPRKCELEQGQLKVMLIVAYN